MCFCLLNKTLTIFQINGLSARYRYFLTANCSRPPQVYFLGYGCLNDWLICLQYIYKVFACLCLSSKSKFMNRNLSTKHQIDIQDLVWHWDCAFSWSIWPRDAVCCFERCTVLRCLPVFLNTPLSGDSRILFQGYFRLSVPITDCYHYSCCHHYYHYIFKFLPLEDSTYTPYTYRYKYIHTHTHTCTYTYIGLLMYLQGA